MTTMTTTTTMTGTTFPAGDAAAMTAVRAPPAEPTEPAEPAEPAEPGWVERALIGAGAGALATVPMTAAMVLGQRLGWLGEPPPAAITDAALDAAELHPPPASRGALALVAHLAFGAGAGALFGVLRPGRPTAARAAMDGATYGTAVWAASYAGWVPALGILPPPTRDRPGRPATMVVAHWLFGAALGFLVARVRR